MAPSNERRDQVVNTSVEYSGDPRSKSRPGDRISWLRFIVVFLSPSRRMPGQYVKLVQDCFLQKPLHLIMHVSPLHSKLCILSYCKTVVKQTTNILIYFQAIYTAFCYEWGFCSVLLYPPFCSVRDRNVPREHVRRGLDERQRGKVKVARQSGRRFVHKRPHLEICHLALCIYLRTLIRTLDHSFVSVRRWMLKFSVELQTRLHCLKSGRGVPHPRHKGPSVILWYPAEAWEEVCRARTGNAPPPPTVSTSKSVNYFS
jgi:hypothetical protein